MNLINKNEKINAEALIKAGKIASETKEYAKSIIKKEMPLLEIAEKIESKIIELGGKPAFPVNLCINEIAAHYTPSFDNKTLASGILKVDIGVHIDGWIADTAFSVDLENSEENKLLIEASRKALNNALKVAKKDARVGEIGKEIQQAIESLGFLPITNLSGHEIKKYSVHAGLSIPNINNHSSETLKEGIYAIEPFATLQHASGKVYEGKPSGIYIVSSEKNIRNPSARQLLKSLTEEYKTLPFCSRWIANKHGRKALLWLKQLEDNGNLYQFPQLVEASGNKVSQAEESILISAKNNSEEVIVITENI